MGAEESEAEIKCDEVGCYAPVAFECQCRRCASETEPEERFHSCQRHRDQVNNKHLRVRGIPVSWGARDRTQERVE